jgi:heme oxygenase
MHQASSLLTRLNVATRRWHEGADETWLQLLRPQVGKHDYAGQLIRMYGFEAPLEGACAYTAELSRSVDLRQLARAGLIAQDLLALGLTPGEVARIPQCFDITPIKDVPEALGWLYVVERDMLLHDRVRRHLVARIPEAATACVYLSAFDGVVGEHWTRFGRILDRVARSPRLATQVLEAADAAFRCLRRWSHQPTIAATALSAG